MLININCKDNKIEDTNGIIRIRKSIKIQQDNGQQKGDTDIQN